MSVTSAASHAHFVAIILVSYVIFFHALVKDIPVRWLILQSAVRQDSPLKDTCILVSSQDVDFYLGKRVVYIYKAHKEIKGTKFRTIWGRVARAHGAR